MSEGYLGSGGRLQGGPADELVDAAYRHEIGHAPRLARALSLADLAHAVALVEGGGVPAAEGAELLRGLLDLHAIAPSDFPWDAALGDAFNSREAELVRRVGRGPAGWLSAGRPRREAFRVALRLVARDGARALSLALVDLADALRSHAAAHRDDLAADYTYLQPAQPTTVGHLLLAYVYPALRDAARLRRLDGELGLSVAGVGGSAGSRWPLDRTRLADLLGCDGLLVHAKDAAWQSDVYVELLSALAIATSQLSQLGQDFEIYASQEFGLIELADRHSRASALMPQKKNPYALAAIRTQAAIAAGDVAAALTVLHTGSARTDHFHLLNGSVPRALDEAVATARLAAAVAAGLTIDVERMARVAREGFTAAADVADVVALEGGVDYRTAHTIVGRAVRDLVAAGEPPSSLTAAALAAAAEQVLGEPLQLAPASIEAALDPAADAAARLQQGSSSPVAMAAMLRESADLSDDHRRFVEAATARAGAAEQLLLGRARALSAPA